MELEKYIGLNGQVFGIYIHSFKIIQNQEIHLSNGYLKKNDISSTYSIANRLINSSKFTINFKEFFSLCYTYLYRCFYKTFSQLKIQNQILKQS